MTAQYNSSVKASSVQVAERIKTKGKRQKNQDKRTKNKECLKLEASMLQK